jgi:uncharacterized membrane protein
LRFFIKIKKQENKMKKQVLWNLLSLLFIGFSLGSLANCFFFYPFSLEHLVLYNGVSLAQRSQLFLPPLFGIGIALLSGVLFYLFLGYRCVLRHHARFFFQKTLLKVRLLGFSFPLLVLFHPSIWHKEEKNSLFFFLFSFFCFFLLTRWTLQAFKFSGKEKKKQGSFLLSGISGISKYLQAKEALGCFLLLILSLSLYIFGVSRYTVERHYALESRAYDLAILENTFWNTIQGDWFASSMEEGGNHLAIHTSFIFLLVAPFYWLFPYTETLLVGQTLLIAFAVFPLYAIALFLLKRPCLALLFPLIYLSHPAIGGANFYDIHELAFAPLFFFFVFYFWLRGRQGFFWIFIFLLLSIKEDFSILVFLLGVYILFMEKPQDIKLGVLLILLGIFSYVGLQRGVIPYFAGGERSYSWYYQHLIPPEEGPSGLIRTLLINPLYVLQYSCQKEKLVFLFQLFAPFAFLCFWDIRNFILLSYGLLISLAASRSYLYQLGFQYPLQILPYAFVGTLMVLARFPTKKGRRDSRSFWVGMMCCHALLISYHYGMIYPAKHFQGGFQRVSFKYGATEQKRYQEVLEFIAQIPTHASVTASETLASSCVSSSRYSNFTLCSLRQRLLFYL